MSLIKAFKCYADLKGEQKSFVKGGSIMASYTPDRWLFLLWKVTEFDRQGDSARRHCRRGMSISIAVILLSFALLAIAFPQAALAAYASGKAWLYGVFLVPAAAFVILLVCFGFLRGRDLPDNLEAFVLPVVSVLREELTPGERLQMSVDFTGPTKKDKMTEQIKPKTRRYPRVTETHYRDPWMSGQAKLADGSTLRWGITDMVRKREIKKKNPRGKIKTKTKYKIRRQLDVQLGLRQDAYDLAGTGEPPATGDKMALKGGEKRNVLRMRRTVVTRELSTVLDIKDFLDLVASAYARVRMVEKGEK